MSEIHYGDRDYFYCYNEDGQLVGLTSDPALDLAISYGADGPDEVTLEGGEESFAYSYQDGRLAERVNEELQGTVTKRYTYDGDLLVEIERIYESNGAPVSLTTTFAYDDDGRLVEKSAHRGNDNFDVDTFEYDEDGQLVQAVYRGLGGAISASIQYTYEDGRLLQYSSGRTSIEAQYNDDDLLVGPTIEGESVFEVTYEDGPVTGLAATLPMLRPPYEFDMGPYIDHAGRSFSGVGVAALDFFLE